MSNCFRCTGECDTESTEHHHISKIGNFQLDTPSCAQKKLFNTQLFFSMLTSLRNQLLFPGVVSKTCSYQEFYKDSSCQVYLHVSSFTSDVAVRESIRQTAGSCRHETNCVFCLGLNVDHNVFLVAPQISKQICHPLSYQVDLEFLQHASISLRG